MKEQFRKIKIRFGEELSLFPFLIGILFLINELRVSAIFMTFIDCVYLIGIVLIFTILVIFLSSKLVKSKIKAALIAALFILINLFYQDLLQLLLGQKLISKFINSEIPGHPEIIIIPLLLSIWLSLVFFILKTKRILIDLNFYLNILLFLFIIIETIKCFSIPVPSIKLAESDKFSINSNLLTEQKPDIYYIVLDSYTSSQSLLKYWSYDNSNFESALIKLGFVVGQNIKSDYTFTHYCIASYLNSSLLIFDPNVSYNKRNLLKLIRDNRFFNWLISNDYKCLNYSIFDVFGSNNFYEIYSHLHFLGRTIWYTNGIEMYRQLVASASIPNTNLKLFNKIDNITKAKSDKPIFAYFHIMMPHAPFHFSENGEPFEKSNALTDKQKYLAQLLYTNNLALASIGRILDSKNRNVILILQGDHGYRMLDDETERKNEAETIFYAIYAPNYPGLGDSINPNQMFKKMAEQISILH